MRKICKKWGNAFFSLFLVLGSLPIQASAEQTDPMFSDIKGHWAEETILKWSEKGKMTGYTDGTFGPSKPITRAEYVAFADRILGLNSDSSDDLVAFKDVEDSDWFYKAVRAGVQAGIINGYSDGEFKPDRPITRQEAAVLAAKILGLNEALAIPIKLERYKDANMVKDYAAIAVSSLSMLGMLKGDPEGLLHPERQMGRADALVLLDRIAEKTVNQPLIISGIAIDENGDPLTGATVDVQQISSGKSVASLTTSADGSYKTKLKEAAYDVIVTKGTRTGYMSGLNVSSTRGTLVLQTVPSGQKVTGILKDNTGNLLKNTELTFQSTVAFKSVTNEAGAFEAVLPTRHAFTLTYIEHSRKTVVKTFTTGEGKGEVLSLGILSAGSSTTDTRTLESVPVSAGNSMSPGSGAPGSSVGKPTLQLTDDNGKLSFQIGGIDGRATYSVDRYIEQQPNGRTTALGASVELPLPKIPGSYTYRAVAENVTGQRMESDPVRYIVTASGSGAIGQDSDGDGLEDRLELTLGTDPHDSDTDKDGLPDGYEHYITGTSPLKSDTDDNGVPDNEEDTDSDQLTNEEERAAGTSPVSMDSDSDGLSDFEELREYKTGALNPDTDGDGLLDGDEIRLRLDPLKRDTNGNGILDNEERIEQPVDSSNVSEELVIGNVAVPSLSITAEGNINREIFLREYAESDLGNSRAILGKAVEIGGGSFDEAVLKFDLDDVNSLVAANSETGSLLISRRNADDTVTHFETIYSDDGHSISASIDGAGTYFVLDAKELFSELGMTFPSEPGFSVRSLGIEAVSEDIANPSTELSEEEKQSMTNERDEKTLDSGIGEGVAGEATVNHELDVRGETVEEGIEMPRLFAASGTGAAAQTDIVFIMDTTGSMADEINNVRNNVAAFADGLKERNIAAYLGLVEYKDEEEEPGSTVVHQNGSKNWFSEVEQFKDAVLKLRASGGGDIPESAVDALETARRLDLRPNAKKFFVLITDAGYKEGNEVTMTEEIAKLQNQGIYTSVVSLAGLESEYRNLYTSTDGIFANIYGDFRIELQALADRIGEVVEEDGVWIYLDTVIPTAVKVNVLPEEADESVDSDDDGMPDIRELNGVIPIEKYDLDKIVDLVGGGKFGDTHFGTLKVYPFHSNPADPDTDRDGYGDAEDLNPKIKFVTPVVLLHGRISDTEATFGAQTSISGNNDQYNVELSVSGGDYENFRDQEIVTILAGEGNEKKTTNLAYELQKQGYEKNKNLFAFNYPNQDMVHLNGARLQAYLKDGAQKMKSDSAGYFYPTLKSMTESDYKVNLIGHSMGGLVSRYFIENLGNASHVEKLITLDTPHWGSGLADASKFVSPMFVPGDFDLDPSGRAYGGEGYDDAGDAWYYTKKLSYAAKHQTDRLRNENAPEGKYFFIGAYDDAAPYLLPSELRSRTLGFEVHPDTSRFEDFRSSIAEGFYTKYGFKDRIIFNFTSIGGDNVVNNQSQLGIRFTSGAPEVISRARSHMFIDTFFGHNAAFSLHVEITHRQEATDQVLSYLQKA